ncbi:hypothetical protein IFM89_004346 [Coptis chinensis]|uniref:Uncharacterized protein n=1 Tax=Coptis chinensis TaxID=261450 RepID=A0A835I7D4_9MAGN|nr:hypothetical protein IFM89_004346 [Coptis chinensis]
MLEELEGMKDSLRLEKEKLAELTCNWEKLKSLIKEKDDALQTASKFQAELRVQKEELTVDEENLKRLENEKFHLEQEIIRIEKKNSDEIGNLERNFEQERGTYKLRVSELEKKLEISRQDLATVESTLSVKNVELEMKEDIDRKNEQSASLLKKQGAQLLELEALYKEEQILRKRYFNTIEGTTKVKWWELSRKGSRAVTPTTSFYAECWVIVEDLEAMEWAPRQGWVKIWIKSDSTSTVQAFWESGCTMVHDSRWLQAMEDLSHVVITSTWREVGDRDANHGVTLGPRSHGNFCWEASIFIKWRTTI